MQVTGKGEPGIFERPPSRPELSEGRDTGLHGQLNRSEFLKRDVGREEEVEAEVGARWFQE